MASILMAFGIDAWWDERGQLEQTRDHLEAVRVELSGNLDLLHQQAELCARDSLVTHSLLSLMGPDPETVSTDSVVTLIAEAIRAGIGNRMRTTALEAMIAAEQFATIEAPDLQRGLSEWLSSDVDQRAQQRDNTREQLRRTVAYVETIMPISVVTPRPGLPESRFPLDVARVLRDPVLEGTLAQLSYWRGAICSLDSARRDRIEAVLLLLDAELEGVVRR